MSERQRLQEERRNLKRAANRRSAQLSRQRKKQFLADLTEKHEELKVCSRPPFFLPKSFLASYSFMRRFTNPNPTIFPAMGGCHMTVA